MGALATAQKQPLQRVEGQRVLQVVGGKERLEAVEVGGGRRGVEDMGARMPARS